MRIDKNKLLPFSNLSHPSVAFLGPRTTFSHQAVLFFFGESVELSPQPGITEIFESVEKNKADFGMVPVENSIEGSIHLTLDLLKERSLSIYGETTIPIKPYLIGSGKISAIREIYSHPQPIAQCRRWLRSHCPSALLIETPSTAAAVDKIENRSDRAAIVTELAARTSHYPILAKNIQDMKSNKTRFFILSKEKRSPGKNNKTSLVFLCHDRPGALVDCLKVFKFYHINLTKIESRPSKKQNWKYSFFVDLKGHEEDKIVKKALIRLKQTVLFLKVLGSYPVK
ncbi:MAG: prephenate dehydratase [Candidatus Aureabacteria bacterium]|nr:prephenate dehydratase [Candidatus Auribacterota bacterium]